MKQFENIFRTLLVATISLFLPMTSWGQTEDTIVMDSVEVSLITCSPHEEVYSLYGHSAIRIKDTHRKIDGIFNYGEFNFNTPHFALRFIFGKTDYMLGLAPTKPFLLYYQQWGSQVIEQVLNLTAEEKKNIINALALNYKPENRTYRYNFFYDNCSTRPRDIIEKNLHGTVVYEPRTGYEPSYREMINEKTRRHPWATFVNNILLGINADRKTTQREQHFLPENLRYDFSRAKIDRDCVKVPLVKESRQLVKPGVQVVEEDFPLTPTQCGILLLALSLIVLAYELIKKKTLRLFDVLLMLFTGLTGLVLFIMIFSEHPTTSINLQILVMNPIALFFIWPVWKGRKTIWFHISFILTIAFLIGGFWQDYAEGMEFVALCLLLRFLRHYNDK